MSPNPDCLINQLPFNFEEAALQSSRQTGKDKMTEKAAAEKQIDVPATHLHLRLFS